MSKKQCQSLDIQDLIEAAHWALRNSEDAIVPTHLSRYYKWLIQTLWDVRKHCKAPYPHIEYEDLMQQVYLIWLEAGAKYDETQPDGVSKKSYIKTRIVWGIRDWYLNETKIVTQYPYYYFEEEEPRFLLDLQFLLYGTKCFPYSRLTPYERYLIFLRFRQEKTILQIAHIVQKSRPIVTKKLQATLNKLRSAINATKDTTGHCQSEDCRGESRSGGCIHEDSSGCPRDPVTTPAVSGGDSDSADQCFEISTEHL